MIGSLEQIVGSPYELERLKLKKGRRLTLRAIGPTRRAIVKVYRSDRAPLVAARLRALSNGPREPDVPEVLHVDADLRLLVLSELAGPPLREALLAGDLSECARAGRALGRWHAFWQAKAAEPLVPHTAGRELELLRERAEQTSPALAVRVRAAARRLEGEWPTATVVHRDLYEEQIVLGERVGLIDLDDAALGPPELDVGNLLAHVELLELRSESNLRPARHALLDAYRPGLDGALLDRCRQMARLRLACIHDEPRLAR